MDYKKEQEEIMQLSNKLDKTHGRSWAKYKGDVINRKIIESINRHLIGSKHEAIGPSVYIENNPTEFDALIVVKESKPIKGTNAHKIDDVKLLLEVKKHGFYYKKSEGKYEIQEYFKQFQNVGIPFLYITVRESKKFIEITRNVLGDRFFCLGVSYGESIPGEYEKFIDKLDNES